MSDPRIRTVMLGIASIDPADRDRDRAAATGAAMDLLDELERLRTLALDLDATLRTLKLLADRDARVNARTVYRQLERAWMRSRLGQR